MDCLRTHTSLKSSGLLQKPSIQAVSNQNYFAKLFQDNIKDLKNTWIGIKKKVRLNISIIDVAIIIIIIIIIFIINLSLT